MRWIRTSVFIDFDRLAARLPSKGRVLDVGCGVGSLDYEIARSNRRLSVLGIDLSSQSIDAARRYNSLPNIEYECKPLESVEGEFDCIIFVDVFHHVPPAEHPGLLTKSAMLLAAGGYLLIKDIERKKGQIGLWLDRYISGCEEVYLHNCEELVATVSKHMRVRKSEVKFRFPFPHYYIEAVNPSREEASSEAMKGEAATNRRG